MFQEIQPPDSLRNILPNLTFVIERRREERRRNLRANEVFLQAKGILESDLAQTKETEEQDLNGTHGVGLKFRETPPVTFTHLGQKVSIRIKDRFELLSDSRNGKNYAQELNSIAINTVLDGDDINLFTLSQYPSGVQEIIDPSLEMGLVYAIQDHNGEDATLDQIESASQILSWVEQSLRSQPKPQ